MANELSRLDDNLVALLATGGVNSLGLPKQKIYLLSVVVAGTSFVPNIEEIASHIDKGSLLRMVRQPKNEYDEYAIAFFYEQDRIGYIPEMMNLVVSRLMDAGKEFYAEVTGKSKYNNWIKITADVFMVE
jgi:hypothetical protein